MHKQTKQNTHPYILQIHSVHNHDFWGWIRSLVQTWDWEKVKKEENDAGVWGPQLAPSGVQGQSPW